MIVVAAMLGCRIPIAHADLIVQSRSSARVHDVATGERLITTRYGRDRDCIDEIGTTTVLNGSSQPIRRRTIVRWDRRLVWEISLDDSIYHETTFAQRLAAADSMKAVAHMKTDSLVVTRLADRDTVAGYAVEHVRVHYRIHMPEWSAPAVCDADVWVAASGARIGELIRHERRSVGELEKNLRLIDPQWPLSSTALLGGYPMRVSTEMSRPSAFGDSIATRPGRVSTTREVVSVREVPESAKAFELPRGFKREQSFEELLTGPRDSSRSR
jgi:hypothetical protein